MSQASVRDLRTSFPRVRQLIERDGEVIVTERGKPTYILRAYQSPPNTTRKSMDYFARLKSRQPRALSAAASRALDEADRGER
jgi:antitoxin (DNA-binding transcriptional repressor) of toxin-antitoxin stability system